MENKKDTNSRRRPQMCGTLLLMMSAEEMRRLSRTTCKSLWKRIARIGTRGSFGINNGVAAPRVIPPYFKSSNS